MLKMKILVLAMRPWDFVDEKTGEKRTGVTVWYVNPVSTGDSGLVPSKNIVPVESCPKPLEFPFLADASLELKVDAKNKSSIALTTFVPIKKVTLES